MNIIEIKNLVKQFDGVRAVDCLSLSLEEGKITSIVGPNGSGKTTLVNLLSGVLPYEEGEICVSGNVLTSLHASQVRGLGISRTFQSVRVFEQMTVRDNILVVLSPRNLLESLFHSPSSVQKIRTQEVLTRVGLWEKRDELASRLSYGQRKLLEIARVLAVDPPIVLFDEPFAGLFKEMVETVVAIMREMRDAGKTVVLIEHNMDLIRALSDHLIVMDSGTLLAEGRPEIVLKKKTVIEAYLGE